MPAEIRPTTTFTCFISNLFELHSVFTCNHETKLCFQTAGILCMNGAFLKSISIIIVSWFLMQFLGRRVERHALLLNSRNNHAPSHNISSHQVDLFEETSCSNEMNFASADGCLAGIKTFTTLLGNSSTLSIKLIHYIKFAWELGKHENYHLHSGIFN